MDGNSILAYIINQVHSWMGSQHQPIRINRLILIKKIRRNMFVLPSIFFFSYGYKRWVLGRQISFSGLISAVFIISPNPALEASRCVKLWPYQISTFWLSSSLVVMILVLDTRVIGSIPVLDKFWYLWKLNMHLINCQEFIRCAHLFS